MNPFKISKTEPKNREILTLEQFQQQEKENGERTFADPPKNARLVYRNYYYVVVMGPPVSFGDEYGVILQDHELETELTGFYSKGDDFDLLTCSLVGINVFFKDKPWYMPTPDLVKVHCNVGEWPGSNKDFWTSVAFVDSSNHGTGTKIEWYAAVGVGFYGWKYCD